MQIKKMLRNEWFWVVVLAGFAVRFFAVIIPWQHPPDYGLFWHWGRMLLDYGPANFYASGAHTDYMPGYMYILWLKAAVESAFGLTHGSYLHRLVFMLPSIIADVGVGAMLFAWAGGFGEERRKRKTGLFVGLAYVLNPAVIIISAVWGQVDSVYAFIVLLSVYWLTKKRFLAAFVLYTIGIMVKPQSIIFGPLYLFFLFDFLRTNKFGAKAFLEILRNGVICVGILIVLSLPFGLAAVGMQFLDTLDQRHFATVNAYNLWGALGLNWYPLTPNEHGVWSDPLAHYRFVMVPPAVVRFVGYGLGVAGAAVAGVLVLIKSKSASNYFFAGGLINICFFMLSERVHERYAFAAMAFLLAAYVFREKTKKGEERRGKTKRLKWREKLLLAEKEHCYLIVYAAFSVAFFLNYFLILRDAVLFDTFHNVTQATVFSWFAVVPFVYLIFLGVRLILGTSKKRG